MKGLIKKDLFILKNNSKWMLIFIFVYILISTNSKGIETFILPFMMAMMCITTFSYDDYNKWDAYALTLPYKKSDIIKSKYIVGLLLIAFAFILIIFISSSIGIFKNTLNFGQIVISSLIGCTSSIIVLSIICPTIIKFGLEKGRIAVMVLSLALSGIFAGIGNIVEVPATTIKLLIDNLHIIIPILSILTLFLSFAISKSIYQKKEF